MGPGDWANAPDDESGYIYADDESVFMLDALKFSGGWVKGFHGSWTLCLQGQVSEGFLDTKAFEDGVW